MYSLKELNSILIRLISSKYNLRIMTYINSIYYFDNLIKFNISVCEVLQLKYNL